MPPINNVNKDFLRQVFTNEKRLLKLSEIRPITVPLYDELSVKNLYSQMIEDPQIAMYLPNVMDKNRLPERNYFFTVINTL